MVAECARHAATDLTDADRPSPLRVDHPAYLIYTSGSTGKPKGVTVTHAGLRPLVDHAVVRYGLTAEDRMLQIRIPVADPFVLEWLCAFATGATLVIAPPSVYGGPELAEFIRDVGVTHALIPPGVLATMDPAGLDRLRVLHVGGDVSTAELVAAWQPGRTYLNAYGPTETTIVATYADLAPGRRVGIGAPIPGTAARVLDERLAPVPPGVAGELYLSGPGLARGYHDAPGLSAGRFVADPWGAPGSRMYRTGDLVRRMPGASGSWELEYLGRTDFQVKVRGFRVELGEIDAVLVAHPAVERVVTVGRVDQRGQTVLVSYVVLAEGNSVHVTELRDHAARSLAPYMVPSAIMVLDALPLTPAGKLDRRALPEPRFQARVFRAPATPLAELVAAVFAEALDSTDPIGADDDFFELGGNSLIATRVTARLGERLGRRVPVPTLFEAPVVHALAARLVADDIAPALPALTAGPRPARIPLSPAQQPMWLLNRLDPESPAYNIPAAVRILGEIDHAAMRAAFADVVARHEALRTVFPLDADGEGHQVVLPPHTALSPEVEPVVGAVAARVAEIAAAGFDVTTEVPLRAVLLREAEHSHVLVVVLHHIIADGFSMNPLLRDIVTAYLARRSGGSPTWTPLPVQYADYTLWQHRVLETVAAEELTFWRETLAGLPDELPLPTDRPRPPLSSRRGAVVRGRIGGGVGARLDGVAKRHGVTPFMVLHAALSVLLARMSGTDDIAVGTPVAGRGASALDGMVGMFVNTLTLRTRIDRPDRTFAELLAATRAVDVAAFAHATVPFERVVDALGVEPTRARHPLFTVSLSYVNLDSRTHAVPGLVLEGVDFDDSVAKFDLTFTIGETLDADGHLPVELTYATDLYDASTAAELLRRFGRVLGAVTADPRRRVGEIEILAPAERAEILARRGPRASAPRTLAEIMVAAVALDPEATALVYAGRELSYRELDERSSRLARLLIHAGLGAEDVVAVAIPRSIDSMVALWAVAKAGAVFLPVDPTYPAGRITHMLTDSGARIGLTVAAAAAALPAGVEWLVLDADATARRVRRHDCAAVTDDERVRPVTVGNAAWMMYTSGSTGRPKGVVVTHAGLTGVAALHLERCPTTAAARVLHRASPSFDASLMEVLMALPVGATLVIAPADVFGGAEMSELIRAERVTHALITPSVLHTLDADTLTGLRHLAVGGEGFGPDLLRRWGRDRELYNSYGPTEATITTHMSTPLRPGDPVVLGGPAAGLSAVVLDHLLRPVPDGVTGEMYLRGPGLARGYHGLHGLTASRFVADPYGAPGERLYRTGDLVRWTSPVVDGGAAPTLEYLGRTDDQVKVRGLRIELGEIDTVLTAHPAIDSAVTVGHRDATGETALVSYVVPAPGHTVDVDALRAFAARSLIAYMVPAAVMVIDAIPLTPTAKLDRKALPEPVFREAVYRAPVTSSQRSVAEAMAELLGRAVDRVGLDDDFFALGGNSLSAAKLSARLSTRLGAPVAMRTVFEHSTVAALAAAVTDAGPAAVEPVLAPRTDHGPVPLSPAQQRMWFLNRFDTAGAATADGTAAAAYNIPLAIRLTGDLDIAALTAALSDVTTRHETLRTVYPLTDSGPVQVVVPAERAPVPDLTPIPLAAAGITAAVTEFVGAPFDVTAEIPVRARLYAVAEDDHVLAVSVHHIAADGASLAPLARDVVTAYAARRAGAAPAWTPLPVQYADYSVWQRTRLGVEHDPHSLAARQLRFWTETLAGLPDQLSLPTDRPRPAVVSTAGRQVEFTIDAETHARLLELGRARGATLFMVVHAAFALLLSRLSGDSAVAVGTPVSGRGADALDDLVGMFVNTLVLRADIDPAVRFTTLLDRVRATDLAAFSHADVPFERLVEVLNPVRSTARHPLFQVGYSFNNATGGEFALDGLTVRPVGYDTAVSRFDLHLVVADRYHADGVPAGLDAAVTYATALFDEGTVAGLASRFQRLLGEILARPTAPVGELELLAPRERVHILEHWNDTAAAVEERATLASLLDTSVAADPDAVAVVAWTSHGRVVLTYAELGARVNRLARHLISLGVGPETRVALALRRSVDLVVAMYAVSVAGGAYVPVDPDQPAERTDYILETAAPVCVLTDASYRTAVAPLVRIDDPALEALAAEPITDVDRRAPLSAAHTAYVIFTSGSTGRPKGVVVPHGAVVNQLLWKRAEFGLNAADAVVLKTAATFDLSVWEFWSATVCGGRLVIAAPDAHRDPRALGELMAREAVTTLHTVPALLDALLTDGLPDTLRRVLAIGETLNPELAQRFRQRYPDTGLFNLYGPTETAVSITCHRVNAADELSVPIGRPEWNSRVYVLDARLRPVPAGVPGELYLAGDQLARGYFARPDLTADRFVANPFAPGERMYRTGDLAAWTAEGELEYRGRTDFQVKIRGFRIEPGEIEAALAALPEVARAAVLAKSDPHTGDRLVAYVVPAPPRSPDVEPALDIPRVRSVLAASLPSYMVPAAFVLLDELPRTVNGKLDREALPDPTFTPREYRGPRTDVENQICAAFAAVLPAARIGLDDNFFELGGNSLLAVRLAAELSDALAERIPVSVLFTAPTPGELAARLVHPHPDALDPDSAFSVLLPLRPSGTGAPLFCIHPAGGIAWSFAGLTAHLDADRPIYGLQSPTLSTAAPLPDSIDAWAAEYAREIRAVQPEGPYHLLGWSLGGVLAHAVAVLLQDQGQSVATLAMLDSSLAVAADEPTTIPVAQVLGGLLAEPGDLDDAAPAVVAERLAALGEPFSSLGVDRIARIIDGGVRSLTLIAEHRPRRFKGDLLYFAAAGDDPSGASGVSTWSDAIDGVVHNHTVQATHWRMTAPDALAHISRVLNAVRRQAGPR
ncbi:non-ribosomal peptide synthetase [Nocardia sp. CC201C]|uniref:non-ribosomal peptide synthetase n=1 Tax=Nocardia sp. CC201C TaxID=3044575 RepID=UPI0024A7C7D7|nr:non-ribosomal peptide synthetase [Nocardia sp. CC201C]